MCKIKFAFAWLFLLGALLHTLHLFVSSGLASQFSPACFSSNLEFVHFQNEAQRIYEDHFLKMRHSPQLFLGLSNRFWIRGSVFYPALKLLSEVLHHGGSPRLWSAAIPFLENWEIRTFRIGAQSGGSGPPWLFLCIVILWRIRWLWKWLLMARRPKHYRVSHLFVELVWVDFDLGVPHLV